MQTYRRKLLDGDAAGWCNDECVNGVMNPEYRERKW